MRRQQVGEAARAGVRPAMTRGRKVSGSGFGRIGLIAALAVTLLLSPLAIVGLSRLCAQEGSVTSSTSSASGCGGGGSGAANACYTQNCQSGSCSNVQSPATAPAAGVECTGNASRNDGVIIRGDSVTVALTPATGNIYQSGYADISMTCDLIYPGQGPNAAARNRDFFALM